MTKLKIILSSEDKFTMSQNISFMFIGLIFWSHNMKIMDNLFSSLTLVSLATWLVKMS